MVLVGLAALTVGSPVFGEDAARTSLKAAQEAVRRDKASPEGKAWENRHSAWLGPAITPTFKKCNEESAEGKGQDFTVYLRLARAGAVLEALVAPETPYSKCFRDGVRALTFPDVPREGYWFEIVMRTKPRR